MHSGESSRAARARTIGALALLFLGIIGCFMGTAWGLLALLGALVWAVSQGGRQ